MGQAPALRVAFAGTPAFALAALKAIAAAGWTVPLVLSQPDRPAGRGLQLQASPVAAWSRSNGLRLAQPRGLRLDGRYAEDAQSAQAALQAAQPDVMVVAAYGLILPAWVLALPRLGCLNIHGSLLPRWRGAAPIQRAIEAGDAETGITLMQMDEGLDTGAMLLREAIPITAADTSGSLYERLATLGAKLVVEGLHRLSDLRPEAQPTEHVTYAHKLQKSEAPLDWTASAAQLERRVRAFDPFPGTSVAVGDEVLKVWHADVVPPDAATACAPGTVLRVDGQAWHVACGQGVLALTELQRPGGRRQPAAAVLPGLLCQGKLKLGQRLPTSAACPASSDTA
jgi:methionyl-tRNA formyltransferase